MKVTAAAAAFTSLFALTSAAPAAEAAPALFSLKISSADARFNGQCIYSYHTGAGLGDAAVGPCNNDSKVYYVSGSKIMTNIYGSGTPAGLVIQGNTMYDDWYPVNINIGQASPSFTYTTANGFRTTPGNYGFLVCNWAHSGNPQLFSLAVPDNGVPILRNCALAKLFKA